MIKKKETINIKHTKPNDLQEKQANYYYKTHQK